LFKSLAKAGIEADPANASKAAKRVVRTFFFSISTSVPVVSDGAQYTEARRHRCASFVPAR
jgi:hypothetical protein